MGRYFEAILVSIYILIIKIFTLPITIVSSSIDSVLDNRSSKTDFVILTFFKNTYEAIIVLSYPLGCVMIALVNQEAARYSSYSPEEVIPIQLLLLYFVPIPLGLLREWISLFVSTVTNIEKIAKNTESQTTNTITDSIIDSGIKENTKSNPAKRKPVKKRSAKKPDSDKDEIL